MKVRACGHVVRVMRYTLVVGVVCGALPWVAPSRVQAQVFFPTTTAELVSAIQTAATLTGAHTITLVVGQVYTASAPDNGVVAEGSANAFPIITNGTDLTIVGNGATIARDGASGTPAFRLFAVGNGGTLRLRDLTLRNGLARGKAGANAGATARGGAGGEGNGGAIYNTGTLELRGVTLTANAAVGGVGGAGGPSFSNNPGGDGGPGGTARGGALFNSGGGTAMLVNSTLTQNTATGGGGGDAGGSGALRGVAGEGGAGFGGAIHSERTLNAANVTIAGNRVATGAFGQGASIPGTATSGGGGISAGGSFALSIATLTNTILAANTAQTVTTSGSNCGGYPVADGGHNLEFNPTNTCGFAIAPQTGDPLLDVAGLRSNGGPTPTLAVPPASPAVGNGDATVCAGTAGSAPVRGIDQRGFPRPVASCAIGAFEPQPTPTITGITPASSGTDGMARVTISGTGFMAGASVGFGATALTLTTRTATTLAFAMPPHAAGAVTVRVTNPDGQSVTVGYTYGTVGTLPPKSPTAPPLNGAGSLPAPRPGISPAGVPNPIPPRR